MDVKRFVLYILKLNKIKMHLYLPPFNSATFINIFHLKCLKPLIWFWQFINHNPSNFSDKFHISTLPVRNYFWVLFIQKSSVNPFLHPQRRWTPVQVSQCRPWLPSLVSEGLNKGCISPFTGNGKGGSSLLSCNLVSVEIQQFCEGLEGFTGH